MTDIPVRPAPVNARRENAPDSRGVKMVRVPATVWPP